MHDKIIHNPKICLEFRGHSVIPMFIYPLDGPIDPWGSISTTLRTTDPHLIGSEASHIFVKIKQKSCANVPKVVHKHL